MKDENKTKDQLMVEMAEKQQRIVELEKLESEWEQRTEDLSKANQELINEISKRQYVEEKLKAERHRLFSVIDELPAQVYLIAPDYCFRFFNRFFQERFGDPKAKPCYTVFHGRTDPCEQCSIFGVGKTIECQQVERHYPDGYTYQVYDYPFIDVDGTEMLLRFAMDITDRKQIEIEMTRLDRLHLVGEMAASIGHEIRNPMTTVRGFLQLMRENKNYVQEREYFDIMIEELDRANSIISEFLSLAKNKIVELKPTNINSLISNISPLIQASARMQNKGIQIEMEDVPDLLVDEKEILQLIYNLVNNALEAMPAGGSVTIKTFIENENVVLGVRDQGHGIAYELLEKLGTPFFTTKEQGTGLGLAVCYGIATRHKAKIDIETSSSGTTFYVRFHMP